MAGPRKCCTRVDKQPKFDDGRSRQKNLSFTQRVGESFIMGDLYAEPIQLNFKGRNKFVSVTGALFSLLVRTLIITYVFVIVLSKLNNHGEMVHSVPMEINFDQLQGEKDTIAWESTNFDIMVGFDRMLQPNIGRFEFQLLTYEQGELADT